MTARALMIVVPSIYAPARPVKKAMSSVESAGTCPLQ